MNRQNLGFEDLPCFGPLADWLSTAELNKPAKRHVCFLINVSCLFPTTTLISVKIWPKFVGRSQVKLLVNYHNLS